MDALKLIALDPEDLTVVSAHVQDAVLKVGDLTYWRNERRFAAVVRRFDWEGVAEGENRRRLTGLQFGRVQAVAAQNIRPDERERVLNLLSVTFSAKGEGPEGEILLTFSDGAAMKLSVECIEAQLADLGPIWEAAGAPAHPVSES